MPKPLMCYTEAEFTDWVCKILSLTHPNDHFDLQEELAIYRETVPPYFARQMTKLTERLTKEGIDNTSIPCYAKNITESVKAWHTDRMLPCFSEFMRIWYAFYCNDPLCLTGDEEV